MLKIKNISAGYEHNEVINDITVTFKAGKVTIILGENGSGKSTLLKTAVKLADVSKGEILVEDVSINTLTSQKIAQKIAYLPQGKKASDISVRRMILHGRFPYLSYPRKYRKEDYELVDKMIKKMEIEDLADANLQVLSGGMQQKVYITMALVQDTPVILLDEPTVYLDVAHQIKLMNMIQDLAKQGKAVGVVLHDIGQALRYGDEIVVMKKGKVVACGTSDEIYESKIIDQVFDIKLHRVETKQGWQYYYE